MVDQLESNYDCSNASDDLHQLKQQLASLTSSGNSSQESQEEINRLENQINFIANKCDIPSAKQ
ncbi:archaellum component FlaC [Paenibacillus phyllosphaerae]|uniref:Archaellum component FlaC n=1 Tax=Paenibacillus phyllosphaerae TaxID=274593 RepID=A0A7W5AUX3_9BACL|nr:archaellum component FlaC [Paenibacillus phyllosphaerae]